MEFFINECSFHEQFFDRGEVRSAFKVLFSVLNYIFEIESDKSFYADRNLFHVYKALNNELLISSLHRIGDITLSQAIIDILFNKLNAGDWMTTPVHSFDDIFMFEEDIVTQTSMAELAQRALNDEKLLGVLVNFTKSKFSTKTKLEIIKNGEIQCDLHCVEDKIQLTKWLSEIAGLEDSEYDLLSTTPPRDSQTILKDRSRFERTSRRYDERTIYRETATGDHWYVDNFHYGPAAHIEVLNHIGAHKCQASLKGEKQIGTKKADGSIDLS